MGKYLSSLQKKRVGAFSSASATSLNAAKNVQRVQRPAASKSSPDTQHSERHHERSLAHGARRISYVCKLAALYIECSNLWWSVTRSFLLQICASPREARSGAGAHSTLTLTYTGNWAKSRGVGALSRVGALSPRLRHLHVVLTTMRKATFLWLMAGLSAAYTQSGMHKQILHAYLLF